MSLDLAILMISLWLVAMAFVKPEIASMLAPFGFRNEIWIGLLAICGFALSLIQLQVNWKGQAEAYHHSCVLMSTYVRECRVLDSSTDVSQMKVALERYNVILDGVQPIPDSQFLNLKKRHLLKIEISRYLDSHPGASIALVHIRCWVRDNWPELTRRGH
jgi:hypothetical protein